MRNPRDRHSIVTVTVTGRTAYVSGLLARVTIMTLVTVYCEGWRKLETMQVGVEEPGGLLESEANHPVEPYVRKPHESHRQEERASSQEAESREEAGRSVGMEEIVGDCPGKRSAQAAEHREGRHQEQ